MKQIDLPCFVMKTVLLFVQFKTTCYKQVYVLEIVY